MVKTEQLLQTIEAILKRGNDVEIRRKGDGYIVMEIKKIKGCFFSGA